MEPLLIFVGTPRRRRYTSHLITSHRIAGINSISVCRTRRRPDACTSMIAPRELLILFSSAVCCSDERRRRVAAQTTRGQGSSIECAVTDGIHHLIPPLGLGLQDACVRGLRTRGKGTNGDLRGDPCFQLVLINCFSKGFGPLEMGFVFF